MVRSLFLITIFSLLVGCASGPTYMKFSQNTAESYIQSQVGRTLPSDFRIRHSYIEKWTEKIGSDFFDTTFSCTGSKLLKGESTLSLNPGEGNSFFGYEVLTDVCGSVDNVQLKGRYNKEDLYLYYTGGSYTKVYRYKIENEGRILRYIQVIRLLNGMPTAANADQNGDESSENHFFYTTYYISADDDRMNQQVSTPSERSLTDKLKELKNLLDSGIISSLEYESKKSELLEQY